MGVLHTLVPVIVGDRIKRQLLWAYDDSGSLDSEMFLSILHHEGVQLQRQDLGTLCDQMSAVVLGMLWSKSPVCPFTGD